MIDIVQLFGQPAISLRDAETTGTVKGVQFQRNRISFIDIGTDRPIPADAVRSFEGDALTYDVAEERSTSTTGIVAADAPVDESIDGVERGDGAQADAADLISGERLSPDSDPKPWSGNPLGTRMLSDMGDELGTLAEMYIDTDGTVTEMVDNRAHRYAGQRLVTVGSYAVIVAATDDDFA